MYVLKNLDHIFEIKTPIVMMIRFIFIKHTKNNKTFTINAGFMLLSPSKDTYNQIKSLNNY